MREYLEFFEVFLRDLFLFFALLYVAEYGLGSVFVFPWMRVYVKVGAVFFAARLVWRQISAWLSSRTAARPAGAGGSAGASAGGAGVAAVAGPRLTKATRRGTSETQRLEFVASEMQGWRDAMEDAHVMASDAGGPHHPGISVFGVFDGHGGSAASRVCADFFVSDFRAHLAVALISDSRPVSAVAHALTKTYASLDERLQQIAAASTNNGASGNPSGGGGGGGFEFTGSTAVVAALVRGEGGRATVVVANAGDSRAVLCRGGQAVELSHDHKPESPRERQRIEKAGGRVTAMGPCYRVDWGLNLSRSLGDFAYKKNEELQAHEQKISAIPDLVTEELELEAEAEADEFLLLGCDGVFELLSSQEVVDFVRSSLNRGLSLERTAELLLDECCAKDPTLTLGRGTDNETCVIVRFLRGNY